MKVQYHFNKDFKLTPHSLQAQLDSLKALLDKRDKEWANGFAETQKMLSESEAMEELIKAKKEQAFDDDDLDEIQGDAK